MTAEPHDAETLSAVADLLAAGEEYLLGVTFEPDPEGWTVGYIYGMGGGDLATAYTLRDAASAALRPLINYGEGARERAAERATARAAAEESDGA